VDMLESVIMFSLSSLATL